MPSLKAPQAFMTALGLDFNLSKEFVALTISAFALTTLDTATRLGRFIFQELVTRPVESRNGGKEQPIAAFLGKPLRRKLDHDRSGLVHVYRFLPHDLADFRYRQPDACRSVSARYRAWLRKENRKTFMVTIPMYFMFAVTFCSLGQLIYANLGKNWLIVGISAGLAVLSAALFIEAYRVFSNDKGQIPNNLQAQNQE